MFAQGVPDDQAILGRSIPHRQPYIPEGIAPGQRMDTRHIVNVDPLLLHPAACHQPITPLPGERQFLCVRLSWVF